MSAAEVGVGGPSAPRRGATFVARLQALASRLRAGAARLLEADLLEADDGPVASWAAALAAAPQAVPDLPRPPNKRLTRFILGFVIGAHLALLLALWWRSSPPPPPAAEMTVELVREMPETAKPKPEAKQARTPEPKQPGNPQAKVDGPRSKPASHQAKPDPKPAKAEQEKAEEKPKPEEKPKAEEKKAEPRQAKPAHQRQTHRAPPPRERQQPQEQRQAEAPKPQEPQQPAPGQPQPTPRPDSPISMPAIALPGASDAGTEMVAYPQLVLSQVAKAKKQGRYMGTPGYAGVRFRVAEDGSLEMVKLASSSGDPNLDIEAVAMVRRAAPFPPPPPGARRDYGITLVFEARPAP